MLGRRPPAHRGVRRLHRHRGRRLRISDTLEWTGTQWQLRVVAQSPPALSHATLVYDRLRRQSFLFGGDTGVMPNDRVWVYDGTTWRDDSASTTRPPARDDAMMAEDESHGLVMFGGRAGNQQAFGDTWLWTGDQWEQRQFTTAPAARSAGAMARSSGDSVLLFGGMANDGTLLGDTGVLGQAWTQRSPGLSPSPRLNHAMASDPRTDRVYLFGGYAGGQLLGDMWVYDNRAPFPTWQMITGGNAPPARDIHGLACDHRRGKLVLFGGRGVGGVLLGDTWEFDLATLQWSQANPTLPPAARTNHALVFDALRGRTVLLGGYDNTFRNDIHEWDGVRWAERAPQTLSIVGTENFAAAFDGYTSRIGMFGGYSGVIGQVSDTTYEVHEHLGKSALGQAHPIDLTITDSPAVGVYSSPLGVSIPSTGGVAVLLLDVGLAAQPLFTLGPPLLCSQQALFVQGVLQFPISGNPATIALPLPPVVAGWTISFQAGSLRNTGCLDLTDSWFVRVRSF